MKKFVVCMIIASLMSCTKPAVKSDAYDAPSTQEAIPVTVVSDENQPPEIPVDELSLDGLVGKWLLLDSEGEVDPSGDYLLIKKIDGEYKSVLMYQGTSAPSTLSTDGTDYFIVSKSVEKYKVSRIESAYEKENNGIGLALIVDVFEDIPLGFFQREDILKKLEK